MHLITTFDLPVPIEILSLTGMGWGTPLVGPPLASTNHVGVSG